MEKVHVPLFRVSTALRALLLVQIHTDVNASLGSKELNVTTEVLFTSLLHSSHFTYIHAFDLLGLIKTLQTALNVVF